MMTQAEFTDWLQEQLDATLPSGDEWDYGDLWREFDAGDKELPVHCVMEFSEQRIFFKCSDGLLVSHFERGPELETIWWFQDGYVFSNLHAAELGELTCVIRNANDALSNLEWFAMLTSEKQ